MLDAFIIKRIQEERQKNQHERPTLEVEKPNRSSTDSVKNPPSESKRGIEIIDFSI